MKVMDTARIIGTISRYERGEADIVELSALLGIHPVRLEELFRACNIIDHKNQLISMVNRQDILNCITLAIAIEAGQRAVSK